MLRFSANISTMFTELPPLERPAAAAAAGFAAVEMQFPYDLQREALAAACRDAGVEMVLINMPAGDRLGGELGLACLPGRASEFHDSVELAAVCAVSLGCRRINCLVGRLPAALNLAQVWQPLVDNLRFAAQRFAEKGLLLLTEVLNEVDVPDFALTHSAQADQLLAEVAHPNLRLQYDVYHRRAAGEAWLEGLLQRIAVIGHIQFSDYPGRHEPGTGTMALEDLFETVEELPYDGWVGSEYRPAHSTADSLKWFRKYA
jgi:hydroxypyruvate isomerase